MVAETRDEYIHVPPAHVIAAVEVPAQDRDLFWSRWLVIGQELIQRRVAQDLLAASPGTALPKPAQLGQIGVKLGQQPSTRTLLGD